MERGKGGKIKEKWEGGVKGDGTKKKRGTGVGREREI